MKIIDDQV